MRSAKRLLLAYAYSSSNFFSFVVIRITTPMIVGLLSLEPIFFSLSLSLSLFFPLYPSPAVFFSTANRYWYDILFFSSFFLSTSSYTNQNFWPIKSIFLSFVAQERKNVCICVYVLLLLLTSRGCSAREKKNVCTKGRELIKHFRLLLHDLLISQLKCTYTYGSKRKDRY